MIVHTTDYGASGSRRALNPVALERDNQVRLGDSIVLRADWVSRRSADAWRELTGSRIRRKAIGANRLSGFLPFVGSNHDTITGHEMLGHPRGAPQRIDA